ncbi:MAG TPA: HAD-IA family hydrolase [Myxococcales bacterium]|nr:HAD-IA family hydrolase [Myxococcales bacterium]
MSITLLTFDVFGTVLDWRKGLRAALGGRLSDAEFDRIVDRQGELERDFRPYREIVAQSLVDELGSDREQAARIGASAGTWPVFSDSAAGLRRLRAVAPCAAITNSDPEHRPQIEKQLGFALDGWISAGEVRAYKPDPEMWRAAARRMGVTPGRQWWHVSAYGDYDHKTAHALGLTCVFVRRPHSRPGPADLVVEDIAALADAVR